ncbi:hypothetical protein DAKH74_033680 [Maudiozyma humilis]|uniref:Uncharacterized protein n=1 Tax=Maudiozyma humilis TaxID=51915 RepID=A0AAV5S1B5_MAUHU|nr:hypothetical protein DAKH74_033680 [Kazachstania humilis]
MVYSYFNIVCQTLDKQMQRDAQEALIDRIISNAKDGKPLAIKKIKSQLELFTGLDKPCGFEAQAANGV